MKEFSAGDPAVAAKRARKREIAFIWARWGHQTGGMQIEMQIEIEIEAARQPDVEAMLVAGEEFALSVYPVDECFLLDVSELEHPGVAVWVARRNGAALGMASLVTSGELPELKRLFVYDSARGSGVAGRLLAAIENQARDAAAAVIRLETGDRSTAAVALYEKRGYRHIPRFGDYVDSASSVCMELAL